MIDEHYEGELDYVVFEDEEGHKLYFYEEMVIPYEGKQYAILVSLPGEENDSEEFETELTIARIDETAEGEVYVPVTDEEFQAVAALYEEAEDEE